MRKGNILTATASAACILATALFVPAAGAARLEPVDLQYHRFENGERVPAASGKALPAGQNGVSTLASFSQSPATGEPTEDGGNAAVATNTFLIEPEENEREGLCVTVDYGYQFDADATASSGADADSGYGGDGDITQSGGTLSIARAARITRNPGTASETVVFASGPQVFDAADPPFADSGGGSFVARIGDQVETTAASANAWLVPAEESASGSAGASIQLTLDQQSVGPCSRAIPAASGNGYLTLAMLMLLSGLALVRLTGGMRA